MNYFEKFRKKTFLHKNIFPNDDLRSKLVENNQKINNYKEGFLFIIFVHLSLSLSLSLSVSEEHSFDKVNFVFFLLTAVSGTFSLLESQCVSTL